VSSLEQAIAAVNRSSKIVVVAGAGISTDSRIPDFRGPNGVWTKNPGAEKSATIQSYVQDPEVRRTAWRNRLDSPVWSAEPNRGHEALVALEKRRKLHTLITQNIDGLHHLAGNNPDLLVEIHGSVREVMCLSCPYRAPMVRALHRVRAGEEDPDCPDCGGLLKSATISFGQGLVAADLERAQAAADSCDLMLCVGSTLSVYPIANVVPIAKVAGATIIILNGSETEMDGLADFVLRGSISEILPQLVGGAAAAPN